MLTLRQLSLATFGTVLIILQADGTAQAIVPVNETDVRLLNSSIQPSLKLYCSELLFNASCINNFLKSPTYPSQFTFNPLAILLTNYVKVSRPRNFMASQPINNSHKKVVGSNLINSPSTKIKQSNIAQNRNKRGLNNPKIKATKSISRSTNSNYFSQNKETNTNSLNYSINNRTKTSLSKNDISILKEKTIHNPSQALSSKNTLSISNEKAVKEQLIASKPAANRSNKGYTPTSRQIGQKPPPGSGMGGTRVVNKNNSNTVDSITLNCADCEVFFTVTNSSIGRILAGVDGYNPIVPLIAGTNLTPPINTNIFSLPPINSSPLITIEDSIFVPPALIDNSTLAPREDILNISSLRIHSTRNANNVSPALDFRRIPEPTSEIGTFALAILSGYFLLKRKNNHNESAS